jgi:hypothetical protein
MSELQTKLIDVHNGSTSESWLVVYEDGRIQYHVENNGHRALRYGCEGTWNNYDFFVGSIAGAAGR